jgi:hypothetical protein
MVIMEGKNMQLLTDEEICKASCDGTLALDYCREAERIGCGAFESGKRAAQSQLKKDMEARG